MMNKNVAAWCFKASVVAAALMTSGCGEYYLRELEDTNAQGSEFNKKLKKEYGDLASNESRSFFDQVSGEHFAKKAIEAAKDKSVLPDELAKYKLPKWAANEMTDARKRLVEVLDAGGRTLEPELAATTQSRFDSWVEEQAEGWQADLINEARHHFFQNLSELENRVYNEDYLYSVKFHMNSAETGKRAGTAVAEAAAKAKIHPHAKVHVVGMTDRLGGDSHNKKLSEKRAEMIAGDLVKNGIDKSRITTEGKGEVGHKLIDPSNRRVDIIIK